MADKSRRKPRQARAESTVDAILEATFQLLEAHGVEALTTNHVAARAGVSIGTLYQYFASKQDILAALAQRRAAAVRDHVIIDQPHVSSVRRIIRALMHGFEGSPATREALLSALFHRGDAVLAQNHEAFFASIAGRVQLNWEMTPETAFVLTHAPISLLRAAAAEPQLALDPEKLEDELVRLLEAYIRALQPQTAV